MEKDTEAKDIRPPFLRCQPTPLPLGKQEGCDQQYFEEGRVFHVDTNGF
jgi:hypothetical protein